MDDQNSKIDEGKHYNTKIRMIESNVGVRKVRLAMREAIRNVNNILNPEHPSPNPKTDGDRKLLEKAKKHLMESLKHAKLASESRRRK